MIESSTTLDTAAATSDPSFQYCLPSSSPLQSEIYKELRELVRRAGCFERDYGYYAGLVLLNWTMLALGLLALPWARDHGIYLLDAVFLAFVSGQFGYLGHDGAHLEVFSEWKHNYIFCLIHGNLLLGFSTGWWTRKHNLHHSNPNVIAMDGEVEIAGLAFTDEIALNRRGFMRTAAKYQAYTFFPLLSLTIIALWIESTQFLLQNRSRRTLVEAILLIVHFILYGWLVLSILGFAHGAVFILVHQVLFGLYMGLVFAPNHKGMPMLDGATEIDFLHKQVITARNIFPGFLADYLYGGLNYQIEHHLFPRMPRPHLRKAREIVMAFCRRHSIPYAQTGILQSYWEILKYLDGVGSAVRKADRLARKNRYLSTQ